MTVAVAGSLLEEALPVYDENEVHSLELDVAPDVAWEALFAVRPHEIRLMAPLMAVRALPALITRRNWLSYSRSDSVIELFLRAGAVELGERPGREYAAGVVARFWSLTGNRPLPLDSAADFVAFDEPGYAKAAMDFTIEPAGTGTLVRTETRIAGTDPGATKQFARYWRVIQPGSGLIRISWLNAIRRRAERR